MTTESGVPAGSDAAPANDTSELTISEARNLIDAQIAEPEDPAESAEPATAETKSASKEADSDPETDPAEDAPEAEPEDDGLPPIERPRSWTKDEDAEWQSLPRTMQQKIVAREQERDTGLRRSQNEAAEERKAIKAEREAAEKARQQYEAGNTAYLDALQKVQQATFSDVQTMDDVRKLQAEDPFRFQAWQVQQMELQAAKVANEQVKALQAQEKQSKRASYEAEQNKLLVELVPEMADPKKASELRERAIKMLTDDLGLKNDLLSQWMQDDTGHEILSNAGIQKLIADGLAYRDIKAAPKPIAAKPLPPVQRPGTARAAPNVDADIQALEAKLNKSGSVKDAEALLMAQIRASNRRAS